VKLSEAKPINAPTDVTCAVAIFTPDKKILLVHPTGAGYLAAWSLPKGLRDVGESPTDAAIREVLEETSLDVNGYKLVDHGQSEYLKHKSYHLFSLQYDKPINVKQLKCATYFERAGHQVLEVDKFMLADLDEALTLLNKKQAAIIAAKLKLA
jgi:ADP-ribose pyrophosphatase YjhB (NUDIX family)